MTITPVGLQQNAVQGVPNAGVRSVPTGVPAAFQPIQGQPNADVFAPGQSASFASMDPGAQSQLVGSLVQILASMIQLLKGYVQSAGGQVPATNNVAAPQAAPLSAADRALPSIDNHAAVY